LDPEGHDQRQQKGRQRETRANITIQKDRQTEYILSSCLAIRRMDEVAEVVDIPPGAVIVSSAEYALILHTIG
jgi:hypothetical protein